MDVLFVDRLLLSSIVYRLSSVVDIAAATAAADFSIQFAPSIEVCTSRQSIRSALYTVH